MQYKKQDINDRILEAGRKEYFAKGFRAGNISTIAANSGVPVGNLYRYFDGKGGLLDAIVRPAYNEIPKFIEAISAMDVEEGANLNDILPKIINELLNAFDKYGMEIIILCDKCATTRYDDFFSKLVQCVNNIMLKKIYPQSSDSADILMCELISNAFINSLLDLLRKGIDRNTMEEMVQKLLVFFFADINKRV